MPRRSTPARKRIGQVSFYEHHGGHWLYYRANGKPRRELVGSSAAMAECKASLLNAQLVAAQAGIALDQVFAGQHCGLREPLSAPANLLPQATIPDLRRRFLQHHEQVLESSLNTVSRYCSATQHLENFSVQKKYVDAQAVQVSAFIEYLRTIEVSPNGHAHTTPRKLRDKGILYILECCRSLYHFGLRSGLLPRGPGNPFSTSDLGRVRIRDAKPIFVFTADEELAFLRAAKPWAFAVHFVLAKTGIRPGELVRLLIEDVDLSGGWLSIRGKPELGWFTKTNRERRVPLVREGADMFRHLIGDRHGGLVFLRHKFGANQPPPLAGDRAALAKAARERLDQARRSQGQRLSRTAEAKIYTAVWNDAGAVPVDHVRTSFIQTARKVGMNATCPKSWRHTFATLLQEANVDLLVRQETLGHKPASASSSALGMTGVYTHTTPEFQRREIERALRLRAQSLELINTLHTVTEDSHEN